MKTRLLRPIFCSFLILFNLLSARAQVSQTAPIYVLRIEDAIHVGTEEYLHRGLEAARTAKSAALLIELDTPGGILESTRKIVQDLLASDLKIIVWVTPMGARAASAGSMITMAAHFAVMAESTSIGAATPINSDGGDIGKDLKAKVTNDTLSFVEGIAQKRGRNIEWAKKFVSEAASMSSTAALKEKVIDAVANDRASVWKQFRAKYPEVTENPVFTELPPNLRERVLSFLSNPNVAYGLLALGSIGIYLELSHPGTVVPGVIGVLALAVGSISMKILPVRPGSIALFILAMILFFIEFVTPVPTHGSAGLAGVVAILLSGIFWVDPGQSNLSLNAGFWLPVFIVIVGFTVFFLYSSIKALGHSSGNLGSTLMVGKTGQVKKIASPDQISVFVDGALWSASIEGNVADKNLEKGDTIEVVDQKNLKLIVKRKES
jgi:membrane-bound serine protease (ClpP class)